MTAAAVVLLHAVLAWIWWSHQELPRGFRDEFFIVEVATEAAFAGDLRALFFGDYYPPLLRLPGVLALWMGGGYRAMLAAQALLWLPVLALGTWWSARRFGSEWGATLAVAVLLPAAGVLDALHRFEPNLGATAAGAAALAAYLWSDGLTRRRETVLLGMALAAGLLVDRMGVLPFAAVPVLAALRRREARRNVLVLGAVVLVLVGWWYGPFLLEYGAEWLPQLRAGELDRDGALLEERPPGVLWALHYLWILVDGQGGLLVGPVLLAGLGWGVARRREDGVGAALLWVGAGLLLFTLIPKRQPFYTLPLLPGLAALAGAMLGRRVGVAGRGELARSFRGLRGAMPSLGLGHVSRHAPVGPPRPPAARPHGPRSQIRLALLGHAHPPRLPGRRPALPHVQGCSTPHRRGHRPRRHRGHPRAPRHRRGRRGPGPGPWTAPAAPPLVGPRAIPPRRRRCTGTLAKWEPARPATKSTPPREQIRPLRPCTSPWSAPPHLPITLRLQAQRPISGLMSTIPRSPKP